MADLFIIGQFADVSATTAVSIGSQFMHFLTVIVVGLAMGSTVSIGQAVGKNDKKSISANIGNTITLFMLLSLILTTVLLLLVNPIVSIMSTPSEAVSGTVDYLTICFIGIPFITAYNIISSIFRGMGDSKTPMYFIANSRGLNDAAAVGIVEKIISFLFLVPSSMLSTVSALGAQNIGAGKPERAKQTLRYATIITVCFGLMVAIVMQFFAEPVVALFTDVTTANGAKTIRLGEQYLRGYVWDCVFAGIHFSFSGYFCACGKSMLSFIHNILAILLVRIPGVYMTSLFFPETLFPMGLATAAGSLLSAIICVIFFKTILNHNISATSKN